MRYEGYTYTNLGCTYGIESMDVTIDQNGHTANFYIECTNGCISYVTDNAGLSDGTRQYFNSTLLPGYTTIYGHQLSHDETWSGKIYLNGNIDIPYGYTLTILPGTEIKIETENVGPSGGGYDPYPDRIGIRNNGTIIAKGNADNIIVFNVKDENPDYNSWEGISSSGFLEIEYCYFEYASNGIFIYETPTGIYISINNCLFNLSGSGIVNFGQDITISNCSFINLISEGYNRWKGNKSDNLIACQFQFNYGDIEICASGPQSSNPFITDSAIVNVTHSNFNDKKLDFLSFSEWGGENITNCEIRLNECFGFGDTTIISNTNKIIITNSMNEPISDAGCGFENTFINTGSK